MVMTDCSTVVGVFDDVDEAELAVGALHRAGFRDDEINFAVRGDRLANIFHSASTHSSAGAASGAITGGVVGGLLGALAAGLIPGVGPLLAGGVLVGILSGGLVGVVAGGVLGVLVSVGIAESDARIYDERFQAGSAMITVRANGREEQARAILRQLGASDAETPDGALVSPPASSPSPASVVTRAEAASRSPVLGRFEPDPMLQLRDENLRPGRQSAETGRLPVCEAARPEHRAIEVAVRYDELDIERRPIERRPADRPIGEAQSLEVPLRREHVSLQQPLSDAPRDVSGGRECVRSVEAPRSG